jgi:AhpD family alkylhydroperoxidase
MKKHVVAVLVAGSLAALAASAAPRKKLKAKPAPPKPPSPVELLETPEAKAAYADIEKTLGVVPDFLRLLPEPSLPAAWEQMKSLQLATETAIPPKYKELIALAVSAQIPCRSCAYFHGQAALSRGATEKEIREAGAAAAGVRHWATVINTVHLEERNFHVDGIRSKMTEAAAKAAAEPAEEAPAAANSEAAYQDIGRFFGFVPQVFRAFPPEAIGPAWRSLKAAVFSDGAIPRKYRDLIALGVAAQTSCRYCSYLHGEVARFDGVTDKEAREAGAVSALTRYWSIILDAAPVDEAAFRKQVEQIFRTPRRS